MPTAYGVSTNYLFRFRVLRMSVRILIAINIWMKVWSYSVRSMIKNNANKIQIVFSCSGKCLWRTRKKIIRIIAHIMKQTMLTKRKLSSAQTLRRLHAMQMTTAGLFSGRFLWQTAQFRSRMFVLILKLIIMMRALLISARITLIELSAMLTRNVSSFIGSFRLHWTHPRITVHIT